ncbi:hypothetical protein PS1_001354 [Malus domestica]
MSSHKKTLSMALKIKLTMYNYHGQLKVHEEILLKQESLQQGYWTMSFMPQGTLSMMYYITQSIRLLTMHFSLKSLRLLNQEHSKKLLPCHIGN